MSSPTSSSSPQLRGMKAPFRKKVLSLPQFVSEFRYLVGQLPAHATLVRGRRVELGLAERIRLVISATNGCVICIGMHRQWAQQVGVREEEVQALLELDLDGARVDDTDMPALVFAHHYAQTDGRPSAAMVQGLYTCYGRVSAEEILDIVRLIRFFNLTCNTGEAFLSRLRGAPAPAGDLVSELVIAAVSAPVTLPLLVYLRRKG